MLFRLFLNGFVVLIIVGNKCILNFSSYDNKDFINISMTKQFHSFQASFETTTIKRTTSPVLNGNYSNGNAGSPTFNSMPRSSTPHKPAASPLYTNGGNMNELDSLLQDLSNARYGGGIEKKCKFYLEIKQRRQNKNVLYCNLKT